MSQLLRSVLGLTSQKHRPRGHGHSRRVAKKISATRTSRQHSDGKVQWEMLSVTPIVARTVLLDPNERMPAWFKSNPPAAESASGTPTALGLADLRLPFELWVFVFTHLQDGYDIHALARVCKGMRNAAQDAIERHASFVRTHSAAEVDDYQSVRVLQARISQSPSIAFAIRHLTVRCELQRDDIILLTALVILMKALPNVRSLSLHVADDADVRAHLLSVHLPHLRVLSTTPETLRFIRNCPTSDDSDAPQIAHSDLGSNSNANAIARDSKLAFSPSYDLGHLPLRIGPSSRMALTHLHVLLHDMDTLETVATLFGAGLVSLRLGVLQRLPDFHSPRAVWSAQDVLARFPRLAYIQVHMFEPDMLPHPIQWQQKRERSTVLERTVPLTVGWVLEEDAWGTLLDPRDADVVSQLFDEVAFELLRHWTPYIARVVYGDHGVPNTSVHLSDAGNSVVRTDEECLGEEYWKQVQ